MGFPDTQLANQWTLGEELDAIKMNARIDVQLNLLAARLAANSGRQALVFNPTGSLITPTSAGSSTWVTLGNVTVPAWATSCTVILAIAGMFATVANSGVKLGVNVGSSAAFAPSYSDNAASVRRSFSSVSQLTGLTPGAVVAVTITATWITGTGGIEVDPASTVGATVEFTP